MKQIYLSSLIFLVSCGGGSSSKSDSPAQTNSPAVNSPLVEPVTPPTTNVPTVTLERDTARSEAISLNFHALVGAEDLVCSGKTDADIQKGQIFTDIRMFISNVTFIDDKGQAVKLQLDVTPGSENLQFVDKSQNSIALLNFIEADCAGMNATKKVKIDITGLLPQGRYTQLSFQLGLPYPSMNPSLTSIPAALAPSDMGWMWEHYPADLQIGANTGTSNASTRKVLNALTTANKRVITLPINYNLTAEAPKTVGLNLDFGRLFATNASDYLKGLEAACNNSTASLSEKAPVCANAFKALGLEVVDAKEPYAQSLFSIAP